MKTYRDEEDYWRLRAFLREVFLLNDRRETSWQTARLDYWRYFGNPNLEHYALSHVILFWEGDNGEIAGMICPENRGHAHLQVHPAFRSEELETDMLANAELCLAEHDPHTHERTLTVWAHQDDAMRGQLLEAHGYNRGDWPEHQFGRKLDMLVQNGRIPAGYAIRALGVDELPARALLSWRVFHPGEPDSNYQGWKWYRDIQRCPLYRRDLDLVAVAPDGELAAFTTLWYDDVTRTGYFEPVGTSPYHQRRGLAAALMNEGMRRLKALGGIYATVAGYSDAAINLYGSIMQSEPRLYERWSKTLA
jgi:ribosomal protein S18 acetylase RimI-like enzyme